MDETDAFHPEAVEDTEIPLSQQNQCVYTKTFQYPWPFVVDSYFKRSPDPRLRRVTVVKDEWVGEVRCIQRLFEAPNLLPGIVRNWLHNNDVFFVETSEINESNQIMTVASRNKTFSDWGVCWERTTLTADPCDETKTLFKQTGGTICKFCPAFAKNTVERIITYIFAKGAETAIARYEDFLDDHSKQQKPEA